MVVIDFSMVVEIDSIMMVWIALSMMVVVDLMMVVVDLMMVLIVWSEYGGN